MISFHYILLLHVSLAITSICLFLFRSIRLLWFPLKNQFIELRKLTIGIDSLLTITGITQIFYLNYQPLSQNWFLIKMGLLIIYIFTGMLTLKPNKSYLQRISSLIIALGAVSLIFYMAINKPI